MLKIILDLILLQKGIEEASMKKSQNSADILIIPLLFGALCFELRWRDTMQSVQCLGPLKVCVCPVFS